VLLKFLNQDFNKVDFSSKIDKKFLFLNDPQGETFVDLEKITECSINSLLSLMYKTCKNQSERIKQYLVQYKAALIMKRLITKFECPNVRKNAGKIIKI